MTIGKLIDQLRAMAEKHGENTHIEILSSVYDSDDGRYPFTDDPARCKYVADTVQIVCYQYDAFHRD